MVLFAVAPYFALGAAVAEAVNGELGNLELKRFPNGELLVKIHSPVAQQECYVMAPTLPGDDSLFALALIAHTLKRQGARRVVGVLPYISYLRQDREETGRSLASGWVGTMLQAAGFDEVVTVEAHRPDTVATLWPLPLRSLSVAPLFQRLLEKGAGGTTVIVAPDAGALALCQSMNSEPGSQGVVCFSKERTEHGISHVDTPLVNVKRALVVDDMLDTGGTLISCCQHLVEQGVEEIVVMVAHGLFTGEDWPRLFALPVTTLYCTDSLPLPHSAQHFPIKQLTIAPLLTKKALEGEA